jgi:hypothetical protein
MTDCDRCFWKQKGRFERCGMKGITFYSSVCKDEEGRFCSDYTPLFRGKYTKQDISSMNFRDKLELNLV